MTDETKSARTTISVPRPLKERMEAVTEPVNWSALACHAFEAKLAEIAARKEHKNMDDIVTRLRASKRRVESERYQQGYEAGQVWVREDAEADELMALERWRESFGHGWEWDMFFADDNPNNAYSEAELVAFAAWPEHHGDRGRAEDFWAEIVGDDTALCDDPQFVKGVVEGALTLWDEVKDQL